MSYEAINAVLKYSQAKGSARLLLLVIAHHAHADGDGAYLGLETICEEANLDRRQAQRLLKELRDGGEMAVKTGGGRKANEYSVLPAVMAPAVPAPQRSINRPCCGAHTAPT